MSVCIYTSLSTLSILHGHLRPLHMHKSPLSHQTLIGVCKSEKLQTCPKSCRDTLGPRGRRPCIKISVIGQKLSDSVLNCFLLFRLMCCEEQTTKLCRAASEWMGTLFSQWNVG